MFLLIFLFYFHSLLLLFLFFVFMFIILYVSSVATWLGSICRMCVCVCDIWHTLEHAHHADHYHNHYHDDDELLMINKMMIKAKKAHRFVVRCFLMESASGRESC